MVDLTFHRLAPFSANKESGLESGAVRPCQTVSFIMHELSNALDSRASAGARAKAWSGLTWP